ncbi:hypothetical protein HMF8227_00230 [Saliniradius amylolyticus]|uniref:N-acetylmuramoyl-L-alanine amidase n=1 Tax=Saliniradius amylolyticus TaxID=2183582 RepID=A0A2S2DZA4_9ALTE|nr:hypothetical protein [Saliniradius amylolyticus]AWL10738.1 hypothetical protein HMF8227_00230 [Saliniradius amylolyticus]
MLRILLACWCMTLLSACQSPFTNYDWQHYRNSASEVEVLLVSDHTLPGHLNLSSGGADGRERIYIDPTLSELQSQFTQLSVTSQILNVEQMVDGPITTKADFELAYQRYDQVLKTAVEAGVTILALHYDADKIYDDIEPDKVVYEGGAQIILDERSVGNSARLLAESLLFRTQVLRQLEDTGLRIRPGYEKQIRFQPNQTLHIVGHSEGGALLLEIGAQAQAEQLFGGPDQTVAAIKPVLSSLARSVQRFRQQWLD